MDDSRDERDFWGLGWWRFDQTEWHASHSEPLGGERGEPLVSVCTARIQASCQPWKTTLHLLLIHTTSSCCHTSRCTLQITLTQTQTPPCVHCWTTCSTAESQTASPKSINKTHYWDTVLHNITVEAWKIHFHFYLSPDAGWKKSNKNPDFHYTG